VFEGSPEAWYNLKKIAQDRRIAAATATLQTHAANSCSLFPFLLLHISQSQNGIGVGIL